MVRAITGIFDSLKRIEGGLEKRPDWDDITRIEANRDKEQQAQDLALKSLEDRMARTMGYAVTGGITALVSMGGWIVTLLNR